VLNSHPIQYFAPLYAYLNRDRSLDVTALYCSNFSLRGATDPGFGRPVTWDVDMLSGYRAVFLGKRAAIRTPGGFWSLVCPEVWSEIAGGKYDAVVLHGYSYAVNVLALLAAKVHGVPVLMRSETHLGLHRATWRRRLRDLVLGVGYRFIDGFLAIGTLNRSYYRALGVPERRIFDVPYAVDNDRFIASATVSRGARDETRRRYGLPLDTPVVLYASKLMPRKHPADMIRAIVSLRAKHIDASLLFVGAGEMEGELSLLARSFGLSNVIFAGFVNQTELPRIYAAADIFVLPSENEPWGLVVNEVMCAGLPVIVSEEVGCAADLVRSGENGYLVKTGDVPALASALEMLLQNQDERRRMGAASLDIIRGWGYQRCRTGILSALSAVSRSSVKC
jgi:glycosyltransferase involved in cell wall biosynthesis